MKYYCGVGARITPSNVLWRMTKLATILESKGYALRSGGAKGADQAFERGLTVPSRAEIFLPSNDTPAWAKVFTEHFHPAPHRLKEYTRKLMDRNAMQILGHKGDDPVDFLVCWTADGKDSGVTGHACRIARYCGIPVYNFYNDADVEGLKELIMRIR